MLYLCCISSSSHNCLTTITWLHRYEPISLVCLFLFILIILIPLFNLYFFLLYLFSIVFFVLTSSVNLFFLISLSVVAPIFLLNSLYSISMLLYLSLDPNTNSSKINFNVITLSWRLQQKTSLQVTYYYSSAPMNESLRSS